MPTQDLQRFHGSLLGEGKHKSASGSHLTEPSLDYLTWIQILDTDVGYRSLGVKRTMLSNLNSNACVISVFPTRKLCGVLPDAITWLPRARWKSTTNALTNFLHVVYYTKDKSSIAQISCE